MDDNLAPNGDEWKRTRLPDQGRPAGTRTDTRYTQYEQLFMRNEPANLAQRVKDAEERRRRWNSRGWKPKKPRG